MPEQLPLRRAAYIEIADRLRSRIAEGVYANDGKLPSGPELREQFGVSLETVRKALDLLKAEGVIVGVTGKGVFVNERSVIERSSANRYTRSAWAAGTSAGQVDLGPRAPQHEVDMNQVAQEPATAEVAGRLGLEVGAPVIARRRRSLNDGTPFQYAVSYLPLFVVEGTSATELNPGPGGSWARIEEKGWRFNLIVEEVESRMPTGEEAQRLRSLRSSPIFVIHRVAFGTDASGVEAALDYSVIEMPCASRILRYELPVR